MHGMYHFWGMGFSWIIGLALLAVFFWFIIRTFNQKNKSEGTGVSALEILKERYARGEINKEEYEEKRKSIL
jgi:putative membrane protein